MSEPELIELPSLEGLMVDLHANGHPDRTTPPHPHSGMGKSVEAEMREAGLDIAQVQWQWWHAREALLRGSAGERWLFVRGPDPEQVVYTMVRYLLEHEQLAVGQIRAIKASALREARQLAAGDLEAIIHDCQRDIARERAALTWADPPSKGGTDELVLRAVVALTREHGPWREYPVQRVVEVLTDWIIEQGYPLPLDWPSGPKAGLMLSRRLGRVKHRAALAGVRWVNERLGGFECERLGIGSRTRYYLFEPWSAQRPCG